MGKKTAGLYVFIILLFMGMICRVYALCMGGTLASAANQQSSYLLEVDRARGMIYDRSMQPLVGTKKKIAAAVAPSPEANQVLSTAVDASGEKIKFDPQAQQPFLLTLDEELYAPGITLFEVKSRYSKDQLAPHIIGYLNPDKTQGAAGIELAYEEALSKHSGSLKLRYTMDALGRAVEVRPETVLQNYSDKGGVVLTLDTDIQRAAQNAMAKSEKGAAVVMEVSTGNIVASVSLPAYDPNNLAASLTDPGSPFVNRAFSQYNVGSTFKIITAAAALEKGYGQYTPYECEGYIDVSGQTFFCHWRNGHGQLDLRGAIEVSCNPYFIHLGEIATGGRITSMARSIGFSRAAYFTEDLVTQKGTLPSEEELQNPAAVANLSFGQGSLTATPIQIAQMISSVANGGYAVTPRLTEGFTEDGAVISEHLPVYSNNRVFSKETAEILQAYLVSNVENGSGQQAKPLRGKAGGKTASAQTGIYKTPGEEDSEIVHAWFAGFYPADVPKYAIVVLVEDGNSGSDVAGPIFKKIADAISVFELTRTK